MAGTATLPPNRLRELRGDDSPTALAAELGKSASTYARYEAGTTAIPDEIKRALALRYGVTLDHLMGWDAGDVEAAA